MVFLTLPIPFSYRVLTLPSLFSGKLHAILCRDYKSGRVKGRDYYDFIWYIDKNIPPDLPYLEAKLTQSGHWEKKQTLDVPAVQKLLHEKFETIDWEQAKRDIAPFIKDDFALEVWSTEFFRSLSKKLSLPG